MQTTNLVLKDVSTTSLVASGKIEFTALELDQLAKSSGQAKLFEERIRYAVVEHLTTNRRIPASHDVLVCTLRLEFGTDMRVWEFECIGVERWS